MKRLLALIALLLAFACPALAQDYPDGIYRGFYYDGGIEQIAIQFELKDGIFTSLIYRGVKYKDGDYMNGCQRRAESHSASISPAGGVPRRQGHLRD